MAAPRLAHSLRRAPGAAQILVSPAAGPWWTPATGRPGAARLTPAPLVAGPRPPPPREIARPLPRLRDRIIAQFRAPDNLHYLRAYVAATTPAHLRAFALEGLHDAAYNFSTDYSGALEVIQTDAIAQRGAARRAIDFWEEVRRLNRTFAEYYAGAVAEAARLVAPSPLRDGVADDDEPYHMRMFIADSLRPPGLEHLNGPGPLYDLREDQAETTVWRGPPPSGPPRERFAAGPADPADPTAAGYGYAGYASTPADGRQGYLDYHASYGGHDDPWDEGNPDRTPDQAIAAYWGEGHVATDSLIGYPEQAGVAYGDLYSWGDSWASNGGTRYMRYESVPYWQKGGREGYDYDIEETLGTQARELDNHVRRWPMERLREPRGQEYRRYGPRSGPVV